MTFFYDLNKKLDSIREKPETTHKQLNERDEGKPGKNFAKIAKDAGERYGSKAAGERVAGAVRNKLKAQGKLEEEGMSRAAKGYEKYGKEGMEALAKAGREGKALDPIRNKYDKYDNKEVDEGMGDMARKVGGIAKKVGGKVLDKIGHGSDADMIRDLQRKMGLPQTGMKPGDEPNPKLVKEKMSPAKAKSFAALAEPKDKITFADKIAGAKKEVDEMLGDVAAEAMKGALRGGQKKLDKNNNGKLDANDFAMLRKGGKQKQETDEGWDDMIKDVDRRRSQMKTGEKVQGHKGEIEKTATGIRHTRRYDNKTGETDTGDDTPAAGEKRGRGRPKSTGGPRQERTTAKARKTDRTAFGQAGFKKSKATNESDNESDDIKQAMAMLKKAGYKVSKAADGAEQVDEKAVSKKQQRFMGMVHATQKGEKAPSKEVAKVAKSMGKKDAEDFASTKHKGLPEKKKPEGKKKEKTEEQGGTGTPTASSGFSFGKGIYDSINRDLEAMIAESMSVNMSDSTEGGKSLTITATDEDALKLGMLLRNAGLGGGGDEGSYMGGKVSCPTCGSGDCGCGDIEKEIDENAPDWPTNTEKSEDAMQYSGGLNGPKSTGQTTVPVIASQEERQHTYEDDELARLREMAGIKEGKKPDFLDMDKDGDKKEPMKKAVKDKEDKKVEESILDMTRLWTAYKG